MKDSSLKWSNSAAEYAGGNDDSLALKESYEASL